MATTGVPFLALEALRGDPILCLYVGKNGCCSGSAFGRISAFLLDSLWHPSGRSLIKKRSSNDDIIEEGGNEVDTSVDGQPNYAAGNQISSLAADQDGAVLINNNINNVTTDRNLDNSNTNNATNDAKSSISREPYRSTKGIGCFAISLPFPKFKKCGGIVCGSSGKATKESKIKRTSDAFTGVYVVLAAFSDDSVKAIYMSSLHIVSVMNNCQYSSWDLSTLQNTYQAQRNRHLGSVARIIFSHNHRMLITTSSQSIIADISAETQEYSSFHIVDADTAIMDFNGSYVACLTKELKDWSTVKIYETKPRRREDIELTRGPLVTTFTAKYPYFGNFVTLVSFWEPNRIVVVHDGNMMSVFQYHLGKFLGKLKGSKGDIVAIDGSDPDTFVSITNKPQLTLWDSKYELVEEYDCQPAKFDLGWPYIIRRHNRMVAFTSDQGVYLINV